MAVFLERAIHGATFAPEPASGLLFADVQPQAFAAAWIEALAGDDHVTAGCGGDLYCPDALVLRKQMAVFLLKARHGWWYTPPSATGVFADVPVSDPFAPWIEQLYDEGVTGGCGGGPAPAPLYFCPANPVTRGQMAVFLVKEFSFKLYAP